MSNHEKKIVNSVEIKDSLVLSLLPQNGINDSLSMVLYYTVDGNRGGYEEENIMVLDLVGTSPMRAMRQDNVISHEMHNIYYEDWLRRDITTAQKDSALRVFQIAFVKEGIAQYLTYPDYSKPIKQLYANKKLLQELLTDLENGVNLETDNYKLDIKRLWRYLPFAAIGNYQHRPNIIYYLSLNVYQSIEKAGGREMLQYVIENPKELINTYNRLYDAKIMNFKPFSDSFTKRWSNNMQ